MCCPPKMYMISLTAFNVIHFAFSKLVFDLKNHEGYHRLLVRTSQGKKWHSWCNLTPYDCTLDWCQQENC